MTTRADLGKDLVAGVVVSLIGLAFYVSSATLLFQGALAPYLPGAVGAAFLSGALLSALGAWRGSQPLAAMGPEPATVPVLAAMTAAVAASTPAPALLPTAVVTLALAALALGGVWWAVGRLGAGDLVRFIPYPVIGGFLGSVGWLLLAGGLGVAAGQPLGWAALAQGLAPGTDARLAAGLAIGLGLWWGAARVRHVLFLPAMLLAASAVVHAGLWLAGLDIASAGRQGWLMGHIHSALPQGALSPALLLQADWGVVRQQWGLILSVVIVGAIALLLSVGSLESSFGTPGDVNRDLRTLGLGNLACGLLGGLAGGVSISRSIANQAAGASGRASGWVQMALALLALAGAGPVLALVPRPMLGGLLLSIGLGMLKVWLVDSRARVSRSEHLSMLAMVLTTATVGFLPAVAIGVLACCVDFALASARLPAVRQRLPRSAWPSRVEHGPDAQRRLAAAGAGLQIVALQGVLFFGSATRVVDDLAPLLAGADRPQRLLLDFHRVPRIDSSAGQALLKLARLAQAAGTGLDYSALNPPCRQALAAAGCLGPGGPRCFDDIDEAVRAWDDAVLQQAAAPAPPLEDWLCQELGSADAARAVLARFDTLRLAAGEVLFRQGEAPDALYLVRHGCLAARVGPAGQQATVRTMHAGSTVGEMGLFRDAPRSATVVADEPSELLRLRRSALQALEAEAPAHALALQRLVIRQLAGRLDQASAQAVTLAGTGPGRLTRP